MNKLNLGCGEDYREGFVNVDFRDNFKVDKVIDLNQLPYPFENSFFDEIIVFHVLEHLDDPFSIMKELYRIIKPNGILHIKVPHFSRGFTHAEHKAGFDVTFPQYFNPDFTKSGYYGVCFSLEKMKLNYIAFFHLMKYLKVNPIMIVFLKFIRVLINFFANLSPMFCSRLWCFWVGGFEEIEFVFKAIKE